MKTGIHWQDPKYAVGQDFILDPSLALYLPLRRLDGASLKSEDAYGHLCTVTGAQWRPQGRYLDGDDHIVCGTNPALSITTGDFTLIIWAYLDTIGSHRCMFGGSSTDAIHLFSRNNEAILLSKPSTANAGAAKTSMPKDTWVMIGVTFDSHSTSNNVRYFFNGVTDGIATFNLDFADYTNCIGAGNNAASWHWSGYLGGAWIYNRALSATEIAHIYSVTRRRYQ